MENMKIYDAVRTVPPSALKEIQAGRLKGKSDINPMWRLKALTEQFGVCGIGWKYDIVEKRLERGAGEEIAAFVDIKLYIKVGGEWSAGIPGTGGSSFVANETRGLYTSDECFKMALTDAISVSCKALGFGADTYWGADATKYTREQPPAAQAESPTPPPIITAPSPQQSQPQATQSPTPPPTQSAYTISPPQQKRMFALAKGDSEIVKIILSEYGIDTTAQVKKSDYQEVCSKIEFVASGGALDEFTPF